MFLRSDDSVCSVEMHPFESIKRIDLFVFVYFTHRISWVSMMLSACVNDEREWEMVSRVLLLVFGSELVNERDEVKRRKERKEGGGGLVWR